MFRFFSDISDLLDCFLLEMGYLSSDLMKGIFYPQELQIRDEPGVLNLTKFWLAQFWNLIKK